MDTKGKMIEWELKNTVHICSECSAKMRKAWQKKNKRLKIQIGDFVKVAITDGKVQKIENLWFEVLAVNKICPTCKSDDVYESDLNPDYTHRCNNCGDYFSEFVGRCDNIPIDIENIKFDDITHFKFSDIGDYKKR